MTTITVDDLVQQVNEHISELGGRATPTAAFSDLEVDSLICVEIAVFLGQRYNIRLEEYEVADAGTFEALGRVIAQRQAGGEYN